MKNTKHSRNKKLWGGRFRENQSDLMERIGESISFDRELYEQDIRGSIAHAKMLQRIGILSSGELRIVESGLKQIQSEIRSGEMEFRPELEDIHMHIENRLTELVGEAGKKLHTARSRNDQIAQDVRLYILDNLKSVFQLLIRLLEAFLSKAEKSKDIIFPGYTHLQIAQPIYASHYLMAHFWAFLRDLEFFFYAYSISDELVLGSGALAGVNYPSDRVFLQKELGLRKVSENSIDAVSQRDHIIQFLMAASLCMVHASRFAEEMILYSSVEFSYIQIPDRLTSGSSIMPQKKNPDLAELIRGKAGIVIGDLTGILCLMKGTPLAYNRDFQEDKPPLFRSIKHLLLSLEGLAELVEGIEFKEKNTTKILKKGFATATDLADFLVSKREVPFREAHEIVGNLVAKCIELEMDLFTVPPRIRGEISQHLLDEEYEKAISLENSANKKNVRGGTAKQRQTEQIRKGKKSLSFWKNRLNLYL